MTDSKKIFSVCLAVWFIFFHRQIFRGGHTGWDTHDLLWVNFLYFSDCLKQGYIPLWNHFIQGGVFFPTFNNIGLFSPFQLFFVLLGWIINPSYSFELMIQATVLLGGVGAYKLFRFDGCSCSLSLFGATAFVMAVLIPLTGQLSIVFSLSSFPWLIWGIQRTMLKPFRSMLGCISWGTFAALYFSSGYLWMNLMNLALAVVFWLVVYGSKFGSLAFKDKLIFVDGMRCLAGSFLFLMLAYGCLLLPGYANMQLNYADFWGDYISPEPRLRSMNAVGFHGYADFSTAVASLMDVRILVSHPAYLGLPTWTVGAGLVVSGIFLCLFRFKNDSSQLFWLVSSAMALLYATQSNNAVADLVKKIPVLNANRWLFLGSAYACTFLIFYTARQINLLKNETHQKNYQTIRIGLIAVTGLGILFYFGAPLLAWVLFLVSLLAVHVLLNSEQHKHKNFCIIFLIAVNVFSFAHSFYVSPQGITFLMAKHANVAGYQKSVPLRNTNVLINQNVRQLRNDSIYVFDDAVSWPLKKIPQAHGYNNLGNPYFWYVKNTDFVADLVSATQQVRLEDQVFRRNYFSDREFAQAMMADAQVEMSWPTLSSLENPIETPRTDFRWVLKDLKISPNLAAMQVELNSEAYLVFKNVTQPGWKVFVDGVQQPLIKANRIFQAVYLSRPGEHYVEFKFQPRLTIFLLLVPYILLIVAGSLFLVQVAVRKRRLI